MTRRGKRGSVLGMRNRIASAALCLFALAAAPTSQPSTQASDFPALRKRLSELTALVERLEAENLRLRSQIDRQSTANVAPTAKPASTFASRARSFTGGVTFPAGTNGPPSVYEIPPTEIAANVREASRIDEAIDKSDAPPDVKAAMHEGRIVIGMSREHVRIICPYEWTGVSETRDALRFTCQVWGLGTPDTLQSYRVTLVNGIVERVDR